MRATGFEPATPCALLTGALAFDTLVRLTGRNAFEQTARHLGIAGLGSAALAAVPGLVDYVGSVPAGTPARRATARVTPSAAVEPAGDHGAVGAGGV